MLTIIQLISARYNAGEITAEQAYHAVISLYEALGMLHTRNHNHHHHHSHGL